MSRPRPSSRWRTSRTMFSRKRRCRCGRWRQERSGGPAGAGSAPGDEPGAYSRLAAGEIEPVSVDDASLARSLSTREEFNQSIAEPAEAT